MFRSSTTTLVVQGILAIIIGVLSVAWPEVTVGAFVILFAVYAFMSSIADAVRAFSSRKAGHVVGWLLLSLLSLVAGVVALAWPDITALVLTIWIGAWALVTGVMQVALAFRRGEGAGERAMWVLGGLVSIALGVVLMIQPQAGAVSLAIVFGLFSMVTGVNALVLATLTRRTPSTSPAKREQQLANSAG